jgi:protein-L-isoaspartate(D-aspartate) O-methyltransferase
MGAYPVVFLYIPLLVLSLSCNARRDGSQAKVMIQPEDWKKKAERMVESQIIARGVKDPAVLDAMRNTPRHLFVPDNVKDAAYNDSPLPIGYNQTISQPYIVALMTELLELKGNEKVLEIGTGSGYQAAVLSPLVDTCYSIEVVKELAEQASNRLAGLNYGNVVVRWGDGYAGWKAHAPYDAIIITAAPEEIPDKLVDQLVVGGRMVVPVGRGFQDLILITKTARGVRKQSIIPVRFVPMIHPDPTIPDPKDKNLEK